MAESGRAMWVRLTASLSAALAGVGLLWAALAWLPSVGTPGRLPLRAPAALAVGVVGLWACWLAAAGLVRPPRLATRVVHFLSAVLVAALGLTALLAWLYHLT